MLDFIIKEFKEAAGNFFEPTKYWQFWVLVLVTVVIAFLYG